MRSDRKEQKQVITIVGGFLLWPKALEADYEKKKNKVSLTLWHMQNLDIQWNLNVQ